MGKKIFKGIFAVAITVWLACIVCIMGALYYHFNNNSMEEFRSKANLIAKGIEMSGLGYLTDVSKTQKNCRVTWIAGDGDVIFDSYKKESELENHADREEFQEALENGTGESVRYSNTQTEKIVYYAVKLNDGSVLRVSDTQYTLFSVLIMMISPIVLILIVSLILAAVFAARISKAIVKPINKIDPEYPEKSETYDELAPLIEKITAQNKQIHRQMDELKSRRREFDFITENMAEGLVIVDRKAEVLTCNTSAMKILNARTAPQKQNILTLNRSEGFRNAVGSALKGDHTELIIEISGRTYQLIASPVRQDGDTVIGAALIILDITEKNERERLRREFTANVSHELKTPLTSISGNAEIIKNGIVKPEDIPHFAENIYKEAGRMITLINDIIKLSKLDEGNGSIVKEPVDLSAIISEVAGSLRSAADGCNISFEIRTEKAIVSGIRPVLSEMVYNVWENAIKYNKKGGKIFVTLTDTPQGVNFTVKDTGIGIPAADRDRVFERFYRVDKSHSKDVGGTGLGLSIVKHGAQLHHAKIFVESEIDKGTSIVIQFPKEAI